MGWKLSASGVPQHGCQAFYSFAASCIEGVWNERQNRRGAIPDNDVTVIMDGIPFSRADGAHGSLSMYSMKCRGLTEYFACFVPDGSEEHYSRHVLPVSLRYHGSDKEDDDDEKETAEDKFISRVLEHMETNNYTSENIVTLPAANGKPASV